MPRDYGYFGKGAAGYAHYMTAFRRSSGGGRRPYSGGGAGCGCLCLALIPVVIVIYIIVELAY